MQQREDKRGKNEEYKEQKGKVMQVIRDLDEKKGKEKKEEAEGQREVRGGIGSQER